MHIQGYCVLTVQYIYISAQEGRTQEQEGSDGWRQQLQLLSVPSSDWGLLGQEAELAFKSANTCLASDIGK